MTPRKGIFALILVVGQAAAQQPGPGVWFMSPSPFGGSPDERFEVEAGSAGNVIKSAPWGKTPVNWGKFAVQSDGSIEFHQANDSTVRCLLRRIDERDYQGTCHGFGPDQREVKLTKNQPPFGLELTLSETDFRILAKARQILSGASVWNRHDDRYCEDDERQNSWTLFCALYQASVDVIGTYLPYRPVMMDVRAVVGGDRRKKGEDVRRPQLGPGPQLLNFNNLESTTYSEIATIFDATELRLQARKACLLSHDWNAPVQGQYDLADTSTSVVPGPGDFGYFGESLAAWTVQNRAYSVFASADSLTTVGKPSDAWLAASTTVSRRIWTRGGLDSMDVTGKLRNGNLWRSVGQCGQSLRYYDVPAEAAAALDRTIETVYAPGGAGSHP